MHWVTRWGWRRQIRKLEPMMADHAVFATNTSAIPISSIAGARGALCVCVCVCVCVCMCVCVCVCVSCVPLCVPAADVWG